jgi:hypothetical protein
MACNLIRWLVTWDSSTGGRTNTQRLLHAQPSSAITLAVESAARISTVQSLLKVLQMISEAIRVRPHPLSIRAIRITVKSDRHDQIGNSKVSSDRMLTQTLSFREPRHLSRQKHVQVGNSTLKFLSQMRVSQTYFVKSCQDSQTPLPKKTRALAQRHANLFPTSRKKYTQRMSPLLPQPHLRSDNVYRLLI